MQLINTQSMLKNICKTYRYILKCNDSLPHISKNINNCFITSSVGGYAQVQRNYCESSPQNKRTFPIMMDYPEVLWPSFIKTAKNWIYANFIIRPHFDPDFYMHDFVEGSKKAVEVISEALCQSDFSLLKELVSSEAYEELHDSVSKMTLSEREQLAVNINDIYFTFPYQIGVMFEDDDKRFVEITMVYHTLKGFKALQESQEDVPITLGFQSEYQDRMYVLNYRFLREFTKGKLNDSRWIVNIVNHFKLSDLAKQ